MKALRRSFAIILAVLICLTIIAVPSHAAGNGKLVSRYTTSERLSENGKWRRPTTYRYSYNNRKDLVKRTAGKNYTETYSYTYRSGRKSSMSGKIQDKLRRGSQNITAKFDRKGRVISIVRTGTEEYFYTREKISYNSRGYITKIASYDKNGKKNDTLKYNYTYYGNGIVKTMTVKPKYDVKTTIDFDQDGLVTKTENRYMARTYEYTYKGGIPSSVVMTLMSEGEFEHQDKTVFHFTAKKISEKRYAAMIDNLVLDSVDETAAFLWWQY